MIQFSEFRDTPNKSEYGNGENDQPHFPLTIRSKLSATQFMSSSSPEPGEGVLLQADETRVHNKGHVPLEVTFA